MRSNRLLGRVYLTLVPFLTAACGFGIGRISYSIYIPVWLGNVLLMGLSAWTLGANTLGSGNNNRNDIAQIAVIMIIPWALFSLFFGMGPPPPTVADWLDTAAEQQTRYYVLIIGGVVAAAGFALLAQHLTKAGEHFYGQLGRVLVTIALPLFVLNMLYWGQFLPEAFRGFTDPTSTDRPAWYIAIRTTFYHIAIVEVALLYLATALFVAGLHAVKIFHATACRIYIVISIVFMLLSILPMDLPEPLGTLGYITSIPAIPFVIPYLIGVNLIRRAGDSMNTH
jgi:hypothetical protein